MSQAQRDAADPAASAFVRANAGSGKTKTLIDRTARLLLAGADPAAILCVTYTRAAAAEMQRRLFGLLGAWSVLDDATLRRDLARLEGRAEADFDKPALSRARKLFARALETPGGLKIQTIHAFCERLLRRFPLEAGVSPSFEVVDDASAAVLAAAARAGVAARVSRGDDALLVEAYGRMSVALDFAAFQKMFAGFEAERGGIAAWLERIGGLARLPDAVRQACGLAALEDAEQVEITAVLPPALDPTAWFAAARALARGTEATDRPRGLIFQTVAEAALNDEARLDAVRGLFFTGKDEPRKSLATRAVDADICAWLAGEQARLAGAFEVARANRVAEDTIWAMILAFVYLQEYAAAKRARGVLDFADLVDKTCALLAGDAAAWVLYKLDGGIDHILLDEAQDTAPDQWKIISGLTGEFFSGESRPADRPVERTLFIVGDNKQSIYSFQGAAPERLVAEIATFVGVIEGAGRLARTAVLEELWRSTQQILTFVDAVFEPAELRDAVQPGEEAIRHTLQRSDGPGCVDLWPPEEENRAEAPTAWDAPLDQEAETSANRRLALRIAGEIKALVARGDAVFDKDLPGGGARRAAGYGDILILVRRRGALFEDIIRALKQADIPAAGADRLALSAHIAFDDLLALARFALYPDDELTLAALLKSPFCGLTDESLFDLAFGRRTKPLWQVLRARAAERAEWERALIFLNMVLAEGRARRPFDFYGRILARAGADGRSGRQLMLKRLGAEAADAIDEFLAQVLAAEGRGARDLESLAHALGALDITVKRDMDEARGQVRVMTAHGAKGLEAPIVILPEATWNQKPRPGPLLKTRSGYLWCASAKADCAPSSLAREVQKLQDEEEQLRLFYVALTRARDRLVLCGRVAAGAKPESYGRWYLAAEDALSHTSLADEVRMVASEAMTFRRYGPDPEMMTPAVHGPIAASDATPPWLTQPPPAEPGAVRFVSPSSLGGEPADSAQSPLAGTAGLGRFRRGSLIHKLLQLLPDIAPDARSEAARRLLAREPDLSDDQRAEMAAAAFGVLDDPQFAAVFAPGSRAEVAVAGQAGGLPAGMGVNGQIDRLVIEDTRVLVVDFKTNRPAPASIEAADPAYIRQMAAYVAALREAFPDKAVEAALVWTDGPKLMAVPENLLATALAELGRAS